MDIHTDTISVLSLCSGGAGLDLGVELAVEHARTIGWVEWEAFACEYLATRMEEGCLPSAPLFSDLRTFDGRPWRGVVDCVTAGYPCQPFSLAGKRRGSDDPRHLWPHVRRVVGESEPGIVFCENVGGHLSKGFDVVARELEEMGYDVAAGLFTAAEVGATHKRERLFILGHRGSESGSWDSRAIPGAETQGGGQGQSDGHLPDGPESASTAVADAERGRRRRIEFPRRRQEGREVDPDAGEGNDLDTLANNNNNNKRLQGRRLSQCERPDQQPARSSGPSLDVFPPGPADIERWRRILDTHPRLAPALAQPALRELADGLAKDRARWIRLLGNGVVPLQAAYAFCSLWSALRSRQLLDLAAPDNTDREAA